MFRSFLNPSVAGSAHQQVIMQGTKKSSCRAGNNYDKQSAIKLPKDWKDKSTYELEVLTGVKLIEDNNNNRDKDKGWKFKLPKDWKKKSTFELKLQMEIEFNNKKLKLNKKLKNKKLKLNMSAIKLPFDWKNKSMDEIELEMKSKKMIEPPVLVMLVEAPVMVMYVGDVEYVELEVMPPLLDEQEIIEEEDPLAI